LLNFVDDNFGRKKKKKLIGGIEIKFCNDREKPPSLGAFFLPNVLNFHLIKIKYGRRIYGGLTLFFV
jgi:hypothetical protein